MTFAIITDIHSNLESLKESLKIIDSNKNVNKIINLGDCFSLGPEPESTLELLNSIENCIFIRGNHDRYLIEKIWEDEVPSMEGMDPNDPICKAIIQNEKWTNDKIGNKGIAFCKKMKVSHTEIINKTLIDFTHAWYQRDDKPPSIPEALAWRDSIIKNNPEIENVVLVHGHVHVPRHQVVENLTVLCQGATGLPFDRDKRGSVAFLTVKENEIFWNVKRFDYDSKITKKRLSDRKPPFYNNLKNTIKFASIRNDL